MINILIVIFCVVCGASAKINSNEGVIMQVRSIYQFIVENPEVSLIQMDEYKNVDESKTYYLGQRQTG